jgi:hypothetical protein
MLRAALCGGSYFTVLKYTIHKNYFLLVCDAVCFGTWIRIYQTTYRTPTIKEAEWSLP